MQYFPPGTGIPSISRKTQKGIPRYEDEKESDFFLLSGAEDLVPVLTKRPGADIENWIKQTQVAGVPEDVNDNVVVKPAFEGSDMQRIEFEYEPNAKTNIYEDAPWVMTTNNPVIIDDDGIVKQGFTEEQVKNVFMLLHYTIQ